MGMFEVRVRIYKFLAKLQLFSINNQDVVVNFVKRAIVRSKNRKSRKCGGIMTATAFFYFGLQFENLFVLHAAGYCETSHYDAHH